ncbi:MAG: DUF1501 domain-containing protein [Fimbriimonadaceae bacterium]|nr:DUF1501 domain-containing protein [Fimbriimonadaceae bacterium]
MNVTRRELLKAGGVLSVGLMTPPWLAKVAQADMLRMTRGGKLDPEAVLVVIQLSGGNDGLNTVIPTYSPEYYKMRPSLAIDKESVLPLADGLGLHPAMNGFHELWNRQQLAIIQNVGYPNRNRSHFRSMDIWQTASPDDRFTTGWIGRHFDITLEQGPMDPVSAIGLSTERPRSLLGEKATIPCFGSLADIHNMVGNPETAKLLRDVQGSPAAAGTATRAVQDASLAALASITALQEKLKAYEPKGEYADDPFGRGFKQIAQLVAASPQTRVIYFSAGGFDTHSRQADAHAKLLKGLSDASRTFLDEMTAIGKADKVVVMVFSEFGRRTYENGTAGTDHGAAAPVFLLGPRVKGGLYGANPDLKDLYDGDIKFKTDFRSVYATALDDWLGGDSKDVLGESFSRLPVLK